MRLENAGFKDVLIEEVNTRLCFGMSPYAPSNDMMMYIKAWKGSRSKVHRAIEIMNWIYQNIAPGQEIESTNAREIIAHGSTLCLGYAIVMGRMLEKEGYSYKWLTMLAKDHPRGRGKEKIDSHEVLLVEIDHKEMIFDPTANTFIPHSFKALLKQPELAKEKEDPDERYRERNYSLYDTEFWYRRVFKYAIRSNPDVLRVFDRVEKADQ